MSDCLGNVSREQMYLPASLAWTPSMMSAQFVGFWNTRLYLGSAEKVVLSRVRRSRVELPLSTDHETVTPWQKQFYSKFSSTEQYFEHFFVTEFTCFIQILQCNATESPILATTRVLFWE